MDQFLSIELPRALSRPISKARVRTLVVAGAVYLNGKRVRIASKELRRGARVEIWIDEKKLEEVRNLSTSFKVEPNWILFEDEFLIAVSKPAGLPTQPTLDEARQNLFGLLKSFLAERAGSSVDSVYLGLHHRLDRDTSGVILFTKVREANAGVGALFSEHSIQKTYQALAQVPRRGAPREGLAWKTENYLKKERKGTGKQSWMVATRAGGDRAITEFKVLKSFDPDALWVEAKPLTGRMHQIRVHLAGEGMPILGDTLYGAIPGPSRRVMLHAATLTFTHPITKNEMRIDCPAPEDFQSCLAQLRSTRGSPQEDGGAFLS